MSGKIRATASLEFKVTLNLDVSAVWGDMAIVGLQAPVGLARRATMGLGRRGDCV